MFSVDPVANCASLHCPTHNVVDVDLADKKVVEKQSECVRRTILALAITSHKIEDEITSGSQQAALVDLQASGPRDGSHFC